MCVPLAPFKFIKFIEFLKLYTLNKNTRDTVHRKLKWEVEDH